MKINFEALFGLSTKITRHTVSMYINYCMYLQRGEMLELVMRNVDWRILYSLSDQYWIAYVLESLVSYSDCEHTAELRFPL